MTVLIVVWGASPGIGKSTLCAGLADRLAGMGLRVDHFREDEILTRPDFDEVAREFGATGTVELETFLGATTRFVDSIVTGGNDVVVADALMPYIPSLLAMGYSEEAIDAFMTDLTEVLGPVCPIMVFLDGSAEAGLFRAAEREGPGWLDTYVGKLVYYNVSPPVSSVVSAADYLRREREVTLNAIKRHRWGLVLIERCDELTRAGVLEAAEHELQRWVVPLSGELPSSMGMTSSMNSSDVGHRE